MRKGSQVARTILGTVKNGSVAVPGALIKAWDEDTVDPDDYMGEATTNGAGAYSIGYAGGHWDTAPHAWTVWRPDIYVTASVKAANGQWVRIGRSATKSDHKLAQDLTVNFAFNYGPKVSKTTKFLASKQGYRFSNSFTISPTVFGQDLGSWDMGLCGRMAAGALNLFNRGVSAPTTTTTPAQGSALYAELLQRQVASLSAAIFAKILLWQNSPDMSNRLAPHSVGWRTKQEWPALKVRLDLGRPTVIILMRKEGALANPSGNHQVLATGYSYDPLTRDLSISAYDPNHGTAPVTLAMNFGLPESNIAARQSTGERLRGFFVNPNGDAAAA